MCRTTLALVAAGLAAAILPHHAQALDQPPLRSGEQPYHGYKAPAKPPVAVLNRAKISPEQFETYARVRQDLMQNPNVAPLLRQPEELRAQALERYLAREQAGMSAEEFVRIHREVQNDPELLAAVESGAPANGAAQTGAASTPAAALDRAGISSEQFETYARIRQDLMQNPNAAALLRQPEDLRAQALEHYLQREGAGMSAEEFVRIHRTVQNDPALRAAAEGGAAQSGAAGSSTGAAPSASPQ